MGNMDNHDDERNQIGLFGVTTAVQELVPLEELMCALMCHLERRNGDGSAMKIAFGSPMLSKHTSRTGCEFLIYTTPCGRETVAVLPTQFI